jgi:small subunit ribosomal protein S17
MKSISTRGKTFTGTVVSDKMRATVVVEWERRVIIPKFQRYKKQRSKVKAHNTIGAKEGDVVRVQETRKLSKTKNFMVTEILTN